MRLFLMIVVLLMVQYKTFSQVDSIYLIEEGFNLPPQIDGDYYSTGLSMEFLATQLLNGSPVVKTTGSTQGKLYFYAVPVLNCDSVRLSIWSKHNGGSNANNYIDHILYISLDSITFYPMAGFDNVTPTWSQYEYLWQNPFNEYEVDSVWFRLTVDTYSSAANVFIEDFEILCYTTETVTPVSGTDCNELPQSCYLDSNGDGVITSADLLYLLSKYGGLDPCYSLQ